MTLRNRISRSFLWRLATGLDALVRSIDPARATRLKRVSRTVGAASCVTRPGSFIAREWSNRSSLNRYELVDRRGFAFIRHPLLDMWVLEEIFRFGAYRMPPQARAALVGAPGTPIRVVDVGGHVGLFGLFVLNELPGAEIISYEPDPRNGPVLERTAAANAGLAGEWRVRRAAAATSAGERSFMSAYHRSWVGEGGADARAHEVEALTGLFPFLDGSELAKAMPVRVPAEDIFDELEAADLIKLDIEGAEWEILADPRFADLRVRAVVLEYHRSGCPEPDPESLVRELLARAGLICGPVTGSASDEGLVWAWRDRDLDGM